MKRVVLTTVGICLALAGGCGSDRGRGLMDTNAAYKVPAIKEAVSDKDESAVPQLVKDLNDEDPAIRFYSIEGLRRLTNKTFGYVYYQDAAARAPAIEKWQAWLNERQK